MSESLRLQKFLSQCGVASRRAAEQLILNGKIRVNGVTVRELGTKIDPQIDKVSYQGKILSSDQDFSYILFHKPRGCLVTRRDPQERKTVYHLLPPMHDSIKTVGRLDFDSEGLLLFTNDGELAYRLTHPSYEIDKVYEVQLNRLPDAAMIRKLEQGIVLDEERTSPAKIKTLSTHGKEIWCSIQIHEGKKRQVRRMFEWAGVKVLRLIRVRLGNLDLGHLKTGKWRDLTAQEVLKLKKEVKM